MVGPDGGARESFSGDDVPQPNDQSFAALHSVKASFGVHRLVSEWLSAHEQEKKTGIGSEELILRSGRGHGGWRGKGAMIWGMRSQGPGLRLRCVCSQSAQPVLLFLSLPISLSPSLSLLDGAHITMVRVPGFLTQFEPRFHSERDGRREGTDRSRQASPPAWPCTRCTLLVYVSMCTPRKA